MLEQDTRTVDVTFRGSREDLRRLEQSRSRPWSRPKTSVSERIGTGPDQHRATSRAPAAYACAQDQAVIGHADLRPGSREDGASWPNRMTRGIPLIGRAELDYEPQEVTCAARACGCRDLATVVDRAGRCRWARGIVHPNRARAVAERHMGVRNRTRPRSPCTSRSSRKLVSHSWTQRSRSGGDGTRIRRRRSRFDPPTVTVTLQGRAGDDRQHQGRGHCRVFVQLPGLPTCPRPTDLPVYVHLPPREPT